MKIMVLTFFELQCPIPLLTYMEMEKWTWVILSTCKTTIGSILNNQTELLQFIVPGTFSSKINPKTQFLSSMKPVGCPENIFWKFSKKWKFWKFSLFFTFLTFSLFGIFQILVMGPDDRVGHETPDRLPGTWACRYTLFMISIVCGNRSGTLEDV